MRTLLIIMAGLTVGHELFAQSPEKKPAKPPVTDPLVIKISTTTGKANKYADTQTARIYILINGKDDQKYRLNAKPKPFARGAKDQFTVKADCKAEDVEFIRLQNDSADMWKCEAISFQFFKKGLESSVVQLKPDKWISKGKERKFAGAKPFFDFKMRAILKPVSSNEKKADK